MCDPVGPPAPTARFKHYSICINSEDSIEKLAASFDRSPPGFAGGFQESQYFNAGGSLVDLPDAPPDFEALRCRQSVPQA